jgi:hypothetical protein
MGSATRAFPYTTHFPLPDQENIGFAREPVRVRGREHAA